MVQSGFMHMHDNFSACLYVLFACVCVCMHVCMYVCE